MPPSRVIVKKIFSVVSGTEEVFHKVRYSSFGELENLAKKLGPLISE